MFHDGMNMGDEVVRMINHHDSEVIILTRGGSIIIFNEASTQPIKNRQIKTRKTIYDMSKTSRPLEYVLSTSNGLRFINMHLKRENVFSIKQLDDTTLFESRVIKSVFEF